MRFKKIVISCIALCIMATLAVAMSGCDDLGAYENPEEYVNSFGNVLLISGTSEDKDDYESYSVEEYFYNKESRENFLSDQDGAYKGIEHSDYVYMAIPFKSSINIDTLALYLQSQNDVTLYINVFVTDEIPNAWKAYADNETNSGESTDETSSVEETETATVETTEIKYDDPNPETRVGEVTVHLKNGKWSSFLLDKFRVNEKTQKSIEINEGQYILIQFRNNSGVRVFDENKQALVDPQTGLELQKADITMTNLLIRALNIKNVEETQGGE